MAYLAFDDIGAAVATGPRRASSSPSSPAVVARLSALEWSVVALARRDRLSSLRRPGRVAVALRAMFGSASTPTLADERLEALRRLAVWSWHRGHAVPTSAVDTFLAAGFSPDQHDLVLASIGTARQQRARQG